jgi:protein-tyrosine phosphatase
MPSILFVCTGNMYRSPIAAAAFHEQLKKAEREREWSVASAGTWTTSDAPAPANAIQIAHKLGLHIENHRTSTLSEQKLASYDIIIVMEQGHQEAILSEFPASHGKVHLFSKITDGLAYDIPDPAGKSNKEAEQIARQIYDLVENGFEAICLLAENSLNNNSNLHN